MAIAAFWLGLAASLLPFVSAPAALVLGIAVALAFGNPHPAASRVYARKLLALSVVGLGAGMNLAVVAKVGLQGLGYTMVGIAGTLALGAWLGRRLAVPEDAALLIGVGTAICGGSAIAAAASAIRARSHDVSVALATVFLLNSAALLLFPPIGHHLGLGPRPFGLWSALAIHDTSSVVGAASQYGPKALEIATTVKLARALWIVPVTIAVAWLRKTSGDGKPQRPWFILGFVLAAAASTYVPALAPWGVKLAALARRSLVATLFLIGSGITRDSLRQVGPRPFAQGLVLWACVAGATLTAILAGWIS